MTTETRKILQLPLATTLDGTEFFEIVQGGESRKAPISYLPLIGFGYLTVNSQGALPASRQLVAGSGIAFVDSGPGGTLTVNSTGGVNFANPTAQVGLVAINGVAITAMRSDAAPALNVGIAPTWTATHTFNNTPVVPNSSWTYAKIQNVSAPSRILGRITAGAGVIEELTGTQTTTLLDVFTSALKGLVPASGGGTTTFLRADGTFAAPAGGITGLANPTAQVGLAVVNGAATTAMRSDGAPALNVSISPTWTGDHTFSNTNGVSLTQVTGATGANLFLNGRNGGTNRIRFTTDGGAVNSALAFRDETAGVDRLTLNASGNTVASGTISGTNLSASGGANPTASVGLVAVNGTAITFMRSDGAPALDQTISPTWTGNHSFTAVASGVGVGVQWNSALPGFWLVETDAAANSQQWRTSVNGSIYTVQVLTDDRATTIATGFSMTRSGATITNVSLGNSTNNPSYNFLGNGTVSVGGAVAATGAISGSNLSSAGGANPSASAGLAAVNGSATTFMRSDGAPAISQAIAPTWTATHTFTNATVALTVGAGCLQQFNNAAANSAFTVNNSGGSGVSTLQVLSSANVIVSLTRTAHTYGNATDNPSFTFAGTGTTTLSGALSLVGVAATARQFIACSGTTTAFGYIQVANTGGSLWVGVENSTGGGLVSGSAANASIVGSSNATGLSLVTNATVRLTIGSAGDWSVGGGVGSSGQVLTSNGAGAAPSWQGVGGVSKIVKTADQDRTSTTTLADDSTLVISSLTANKRYAVECFIRWNQQGSTTNGIQLKLNVTGGTPSANWAVFSSLTNTTSGNASPTANSSDDSSIFSQTIGSAGITVCTYLVATVTADAATALAIAFQWAQASSVATATRVLAGSWMKVTQLN